MTETCENCGRPVLPTDSVCWHCGYTLPKRKAPVKQSKPSGTAAATTGLRLPTTQRDTTTDAPPYDLRALAVYAVLTVVVLVAFGLVLVALGRRPILVRSASLALGSDWITVTDAELRYAVSLPETWQWVDGSYRDQQQLLRDVAERQAYLTKALHPLGDLAGDVTLLAVAVDAPTLELADPTALLVIGTSNALRQMTPREALDALGTRSLTVSEQAVDDHLPTQPQARYNVLDRAENYQCRHLFLTEPEADAYLVAACAPQGRFAMMRRDLDSILDSFQLLQH